MPYAAPVALGTALSGIGSQNGVSMTTSTGISVGDLAVAFAFLPDDGISLGPTVTAFSDSAGNTWTIAATHRDSRNALAYMAVGVCLSATSAMASGGSISVAMTGATTSFKSIQALKVSGVGFSAIDKVIITGEGTGNTWSADATGTLSDPDEIVFAFAVARGTFFSGPSGGTNTPSGGFTDTALNNYSANQERTVEYKILSGSTASQTGGGTWNPGGGGDPPYSTWFTTAVSFMAATATSGSNRSQMVV